MERQPTATTRLTNEQLDEIVRRLVDALSPQRIYLFGSHACGAPHAESDIDVMIVMDDDVEFSAEFLKRGYACLRGTGLPVELHVSSRVRFERFADVFGSLQHEIRRKGVVLYASEA